MGAIAGSLSYSLFRVRGELPRGFRNRFVEAVRLRAFRPLEPQDEEDERIGWCVCGRVLDLELEHDKLYREPYLLLGLRIDKWRIPTALLRANLEAAVQEQRERSGRDRISKRERDELKQRVVMKLRRKVVPSLRCVDLSWNLDTGRVRFWSHSPRLEQELSVLFEQTFNLQLEAHSPYTAASNLELSDARLEALSGVAPSQFDMEP